MKEYEGLGWLKSGEMSPTVLHFSSLSPNPPSDAGDPDEALQPVTMPRTRPSPARVKSKIQDGGGFVGLVSRF